MTSTLKRKNEDDDCDNVDNTLVKKVKSDSLTVVEWQLFHKSDNGDADAQYELAKLYEDGVLISQNLIKAKEWYIKSANGGNVNAHYWILQNYDGNTHQFGKSYRSLLNGVTKTENDIFFSNAEIQYKIGDYYSQFDEEVDNVEKWYLASANQDNPIAELKLAVLYNSMERYKDALLWFKKCGDTNSYVKIAEYYEHGKNVIVDDDGMIEPLIIQDELEALHWYQLANHTEKIKYIGSRKYSITNGKMLSMKTELRLANEKIAELEKNALNATR